MERPILYAYLTKDKGIVDSGCSRHMTGNNAHLADYQEFKVALLPLENKVLFTDTDCLVFSPDFKLPDENQVKTIRSDNGTEFKNDDLVEFYGLKGIKREYSNARTPQKNEVAERKNKTLIKATRTMLADSFLPTTFWAEIVSTACYVLNREELKKLKRQEKEANDAARKETTHETQNANTNSTNLLNVVSTPISTAGPSRVQNNDEPLYLNDPSMPHLEDIYASPSEGVFTDSSYDDEGVVTDFNSLETTVKVSPTYTTRIHTIYPKTQILGDPLSAVQTRSRVNKNFKAHALISQALEDESWVDAMQEELLQFQIQKSAFLYGIINEEVYVTQPPGFVDPKFPNKVYKVVKALYGLHQALGACVKTASTPIETQNPLVKDEAVDVDVTPKTSHLQAVKRIFRYLKGQPKLGLWYPKVSSFDLEAYLDIDYAGVNLDRKLIIEGCQFLGRRLISWQCKNQTIMATSTIEAEYVAAAHCYG
nr:ribonuclease H-like domain, reverse transcriptase, RNA-dependent DNA polymerase [Tanacetum cinerariifolium]